MKKEIADRWVAELRSGRHKQARGTMKDPCGGLCCLGVLQQEVLGLPVPEGYPVLSTEAVKAAGMKSEIGGDSEFQRNKAHLPGLNDGNSRWGGRSKTFPEIADIIEANWESL